MPFNRHFPDGAVNLTDISQITFKSRASVPKRHRHWYFFPPQPSDSPILVIWPCSEARSANFLVFQTHLSLRFYLAVDFLGLGRSGSWSQIINQNQDFLEQASRHRYLSQLERDVPPVTDDLGPDPHQLLP